MSDGYSFRLLDLTPAELEKTSALLRSVFRGAHHLTPPYLRWQYAENPDGRAIGCNAYLGDALVGHMTAVPMKGRLDGEVRPGLFMLNGAVHPAHQGRKIQSRISAAIFDEAVRLGYDFCFGTGNKYSTGPLLTRFRLVKPLEARIGFGPLRRHARAASFDRVWSEPARRWRLANPERAYCVSRTRTGSLVSAPTGVPRLAASLYDGPEAWPDEGRAAAAPRLRLWIGLDPSIDWSASLYLPIPARLRPSPLNLVFKDLTGGSYLPDPERVAFRGIDFDPW